MIDGIYVVNGAWENVGKHAKFSATEAVKP
jgi:hypothetical protein